MNAAVRLEILRASTAGLAGLAATRLASIAPRALGADGFDAWRRHFEAHLRVLGSALEDGVPERYAEHVAWLRDARLAREGDARVIGAALDALAAVLAEELPSSADDALARCLAAARARLAERVEAPQVPPPADPEVRAYVEAVLALDRPGALALVDAALERGAASPASVLDVLLPTAQRYVGALWHAGAIGVAHEHFATEVARDCIARLVARAGVGAPQDAPLVVVSGIQGDGHELGVRLVAAAFELARWRTAFLGANTPIDELAAFVQPLDVRVVALGATLDEHRAAVAQGIAALRRARGDCKILVGGSAFAGPESLWQRTGADGVAPRPTDAPLVAARWLESGA